VKLLLTAPSEREAINYEMKLFGALHYALCELEREEAY
jgi:hypothetical protein